MTDNRFFTNHGPFRLSDIAAKVGAELVGADKEALDVSPLAAADASHLSFLDNIKYKDDFASTKAGACFIDPKHQAIAPIGISLLLSADPYRAYAKAAQLFYPLPHTKKTQIAPSAVVSESAQIAEGCIIEAGAIIGDGVQVGAGTYIGHNAVLTHCIIGAKCIIHRGVAIGQDGFGFAMGAQGHEKVPQLGRVIIGNMVEIGANSCVDRGTGPDTIIGDGTKMDNLVQVAHNVQIGRACVIAGQAGVSGSSKLGDGVVIAGQAGVAGHLNIESGVQIAGQSGVMTNIPAGQKFGGTPAQPVKDWHRQSIALKRLSAQKKEA